MKRTNIMKKIACLCLAVTATLGVVSADAAVTGYTINSGNTVGYTDASLSVKKGTIYGTDELTLVSYSDNYAIVTYPLDKGGTKTVYVPRDAVMIGVSPTKVHVNAKVTTYVRPNGRSYGYISNEDILVFGAQNGWSQIYYRTTSGNGKMAWVSTSQLNGGSQSGSTQSSGWQYPMSNAYVSGNDWHTYYAARASAGRPYHVGLDLKSSNGSTAIYAAASGTVVRSGWNNANGNYVVISHSLSGKTVYSFYAHMSSRWVSAGQSVSKGDQIGVMGNTGSASAGAHLHFSIVDSIRDGSYYGYVPSFSGDKVTYSGVTFYNPRYVISNGCLPG